LDWKIDIVKELKFPSYEWLKALPLKRTRTHKDTISGKLYEEEEHCEYKFNLFDTPVFAYGQLSYNEDDSRYIYFDVMENGYSNMNSYGLELKFNKKNYQKLCKHAQEVYEMFYRELDKDMSWQWDCTPEECFEKYIW
jgi:thymidylate synthase ThyX